MGVFSIPLGRTERWEWFPEGSSGAGRNRPQWLHTNNQIFKDEPTLPSLTLGSVKHQATASQVGPKPFSPFFLRSSGNGTRKSDNVWNRCS